MTSAERGLQQVLDGRPLEGLAAIEAGMEAATSSHWLPLLKKAVDHASHHGNGPSAAPEEALRRALAKALALAPSDWELRCLRATLLTGRSDFDGALADFEAAIRLAPGSAKPYSDRAFLRTRQGDWAGALADLDRAAELGGGGGLVLERGLVLLSLGRAAEARELFAKAAAGSRDPEALFQLGRSLVVEGKPAEALAPIRAALEGTGEGSSRRRSYELLEAAASAFAHVGAAKGASVVPGEKFMQDAKNKAEKDGKGCLWLFGVGIDRPYEVTLNTLMALKRCDAVYTQADTREVRELLEAVYPGVRSIAHGGGSKRNPQDEVWKSVREALDRGLQTGYVTYGHPMLFGEGNLLAKRCKEAGYRYRVMTAPSSIDGILTMLQDDLDLCDRGFSVANARSLAEADGSVDPSKGSIILGINRLMEEGTFGKFCDVLDAAYPSGHPVYGLKCADGWRDEARVELTVASFRAGERSLDPALTLFIPERKTRPARKPAAKRRAA